MRIIGIENQNNLLAFIKKDENAFQKLQTNPNKNEIYGFNANIS